MGPAVRAMNKMMCCVLVGVSIDALFKKCFLNYHRVVMVNFKMVIDGTLLLFRYVMIWALSTLYIDFQICR